MRKGCRHTEETKRKIGEANSLKRRTDEVKKRISENNAKFWKGKHLSKETKKKLSEAHKGKKASKETRKKRSESLSGDKCYLWKGGINSINDTIRKSVEYKLWREDVYKRDDFTCQKCSEYGGVLNAHHIQNFADYVKLRFIVKNGITLCKKCHKKFHSIYGKKNNNQEQLNEFLSKTNEEYNPILITG